MPPSTLYPLSSSWGLLLRDLGISGAHVLKRAGVAEDLLTREHAMVSAEEFCRMMWALDAEAADPTLAIRISQALSFETFDPAVFAAMCSTNLDSALLRISKYKRMCAPIALVVTVGAESTRCVVEWAEPPLEPPPLMFALDLAYCTRLARLGTRRPVRPRRVTCPHRLEPVGAYAEYFGVAVERARETSLEFEKADATAPFLTAKAAMWSFFEPELRRRLAELDAKANTTDRVHAALLELLPSARASVNAVAARLGVSVRTLQRRLRDEGATFQSVLDATREELARHYLRTTALPGSEISFLLGFEDPNSFVRAFRDWTGITPERLRAELRSNGTDG